MTTTSTQFSLLSPKSWFSWQAVRDNFLPWVVPVGALIIWQILAQIGWLSTRVLPSPISILYAGWKLAQSGELWIHLGVSSRRALVGFAIGGGIGFFWLSGNHGVNCKY
jgi:sulfonate transport system permease protein